MVTADDRAETIAGMRELLDFLEAHPVIPIGIITEHGTALYPRNAEGGQDIPAALAQLREIGKAIGVEPTVPYGRHVYVRGPKFRGGVEFVATVCDAEDLFKKQEAAQDITPAVGEVAGAHGDGAPATATAQTAAGSTLPADGTSDAGAPFPGDVSAADPGPAPSAGGAAVTPDEPVWVAVRRWGVDFHADDNGQTRCGRSTDRGLRLERSATGDWARPCPRCYPAPDGRGAGLS